MLAHLLPWDSTHFGYTIAQADLHSLTADSVKELISWCQTNEVEGLYFLADSNDPVTVLLAEDNNFHLMDIRMVLTRDLGKRIPIACTNITMRYGQPTDVPVLRDLATYHDSRFYYDLHLQPKCDEMFRIWIERSCTGYADQVFIGELDGQIASYITVKKNEIVLVGSGDRYQYRGATGELLWYALHYLNEQGYAQAVVTTQGRNLAALRLYQTSGFITSKVQLYYHVWFER